jgi:hypothetical protein
MTNAEWALPAEKVATGGLMMTRWGRADLSSPYLAAMKARVEEPVLRQYIMLLHCEQIVPRLFRISH